MTDDRRDDPGTGPDDEAAHDSTAAFDEAVAARQLQTGAITIAQTQEDPAQEPEGVTQVLSPRMPGPHDGKRLSPWRVLIGLGVVAAVVVGGVFLYRGYVFAEARTDPAEPWFAAYVDVTATPTYAFESPTDAAQRDVVLSFIVAADETSCEPSWGAAYSLDQAGAQLDLDRRIARIREQNGDVVGSFGGAINTELATACTDPVRLVDAYQQVVDQYSLDTIDLDIEADDLADTAAGQRRAAAIAELQDDRAAAGDPLAVWLTLPVARTGLTAEGLEALAQLLDAGVDVAGVNAMTMDYGVDLEGDSMAQVSEDALNAVHEQVRRSFGAVQSPLSDAEAWAKVAATPMIGQNDVVAEVFTLADAQALNTFAREQGLGRMSMWSLNRDRTCGPNYGDIRVVSDSCSGVDQGDQTFAPTLSPGFGGRIPQATTVPTATPTPTPRIVDDPATSPYPVWSPTATYVAGDKVVWHGNVYVSKWWNRGSLPDNPVVAAGDTPWTIIGPVLPGETPQPKPTVPAGLLPEWSGTTVYVAGDRVLFEGIAYQAKWWTQGDSPAAAAASADAAGSPWVALTAAEVAALVSGG